MNDVDKFRNDFFEKLIKAEKEKIRAEEQLQKNCYHNYNIMGITKNDYQERQCSKCNHKAIKSVRIWQGTKNGNCIIA
jgi:hypothetical protein